MLKLIFLCSLPLLAQGACPTIITRSEWGAKSPKSTPTHTASTPSFIVVHHSDTPACLSTSACKNRVKNIQNHHMNTNGWQDIGYNFLIGGDGQVYEGRGWGIHGAHVPKYNSNSIGVCVIGNFQNQAPSQAQLQALKDLISCAKENNHVTPSYRLIGHRQGGRTSCPGNKLYDEISNWPDHDASIRP